MSIKDEINKSNDKRIEMDFPHIIKGAALLIERGINPLNALNAAMLRYMKENPPASNIEIGEVYSCLYRKFAIDELEKADNKTKSDYSEALDSENIYSLEAFAKNKESMRHHQINKAKHLTTLASVHTYLNEGGDVVQASIFAMLNYMHHTENLNPTEVGEKFIFIYKEFLEDVIFGATEKDEE